MAPARGILDKLAYTRASTGPRSCTHTHRHTRTHARIRMPSQVPSRARTHTHKYVILIAFQGNSVFVNAPQYYVTHALPLAFRLFRLLSPLLVLAIHVGYLIIVKRKGKFQAQGGVEV